MAKRSPKNRTVNLPIDRLAASRWQAEYYEPLDATTREALRDDLERNGQRDSIHVVPLKWPRDGAEYEILDGHQRIELLRELGSKTVRATIREDLASATAFALESEFLQLNYNRRQLHPLDRARIGLRLAELERERQSDDEDEDDRGELRDRVGEILGLSGRTLSRWWALLRAPREIQQAYRAGHLQLIEAGRISQLDEEAQEELLMELDEVEGDEEIARVVRDHLRQIRRRRPPSGPRFPQSIQKLCTALERAEQEIGRPSFIHPDFMRFLNTTTRVGHEVGCSSDSV